MSPRLLVFLQRTTCRKYVVDLMELRESSPRDGISLGGAFTNGMHVSCSYFRGLSLTSAKFMWKTAELTEKPTQGEADDLSRGVWHLTSGVPTSAAAIKGAVMCAAKPSSKSTW
jgi:hypothetical protein